MAIFGNKKEIKVEEAKAPAKKAAPKKPAAKKATIKKAPAKTAAAATRGVLVRPHITEKAAQATARNVYTFEVVTDATKGEIAAQINAVYKVKPQKVTIVKTPSKRVRLRTRRGYGTKGGMKKAYVYLKKGDRIEFSS